jgi:hypothetical protein
LTVDDEDSIDTIRNAINKLFEPHLQQFFGIAPWPWRILSKWKSREGQRYELRSVKNAEYMVRDDLDRCTPFFHEVKNFSYHRLVFYLVSEDLKRLKKDFSSPLLKAAPILSSMIGYMKIPGMSTML